MTEFNFPRPLRLAAGSHEKGSGKGCAMNVISYENGDTEITDFPDCSARPLARIVQRLNDGLADRDGFLLPESSITVLEIGHLTVGTADYTHEQLKRWLHDILVDSSHGVVNFVPTTRSADAVRRVADLLVRDTEPTRGEWQNALYAVDTTTAAYAADAAYNATYAAYDAAYVSRVEFTRWAVQRFRDILGLDAPAVGAERTAAAVAEMEAVR